MAIIGFLHTSAVHTPTFAALLAELAPSTTSVAVVDESLLSDAREQGAEAVSHRVAAAVQRLREQGAEIVCCTCSTIGAIAEAAPVGVPVFRVDRPMARRAVEIGTRIGVVVAVESTIAPTTALLREEAQAVTRSMELKVSVADGAWARFEAGDRDGYLRIVAETAGRLAAEVDVIVLAQASMVGAEALLTGAPIPILSSPRLAAEHLAARCAYSGQPGDHEQQP